MMTDTDPSHIAAEIFATHSIDFYTARQAGGWTNANWIAGGRMHCPARVVVAGRLAGAS